MSWWNGTEEFWEKQKFLVLNDKWLFLCLLTFISREDIITRYNYNQVRCFVRIINSRSSPTAACMSVLDISWDLLFWKIWFCFSDICQSSGSLSDKIHFWIHKSHYNRQLLVFVRKLLFWKYCMSELFEKNLWMARIFRKVAGCKNSLQGFLAF